MNNNLEIVTAFALLIGYCYTLIIAHGLLVNLDKLVGIPRRKSGEIRITDITELGLTDPKAKRVVVLLRINNYIVYIFFALLICSLLFEGTSSFTSLRALTENIHP